tara:strand:- start:216 stop:446 length:231 start_codon:yes stop_codon:yes gene_type:complete
VKLIIQIPSYNEEKSLPQTIDQLPRKVKGFPFLGLTLLLLGSTLFKGFIEGCSTTYCNEIPLNCNNWENKFEHKLP